MSDLSVNGARVTSASLVIPYYGPWSADIALAGEDTPTGDVSIVASDLTLKGTVIRSAKFAGAGAARIVGGKAGWKKIIPERGYSHAAGVKASTVLQDAARESGETIVVDADRVIGQSYVREIAKAERVLRLLTDGGKWWIDAAGVTQTKARDATLITNPFTVITQHGAQGRFEIASDSLVQWQPGRTFKAPNITGTHTVSSVTIVASNTGKLRLFVLTVDSAIERLREDLRAIIRAESPQLTYSGVWEYKITAGTSSTIDATPTDPRMPPITKCPMMPGLLGETVTPTPGSLCRVVFVNQDPTRPECIGIAGTPLLSAIDATTAVRIGAGVRPIIGAGDFAGIFPCIPTQVKGLI